MRAEAVRRRPARWAGGHVQAPNLAGVASLWFSLVTLGVGSLLGFGSAHGMRAIDQRRTRAVVLRQLRLLLKEIWLQADRTANDSTAEYKLTIAVDVLYSSLLGENAVKALSDAEAAVLIPEALTLRDMSEMGRLARDWQMSGHPNADLASAMDDRDRPDRIVRFKRSAERSLAALHDSIANIVVGER
jgi:hypothetical protein